MGLTEITIFKFKNMITIPFCDWSKLLRSVSKVIFRISSTHFWFRNCKQRSFLFLSTVGVPFPTHTERSANMKINNRMKKLLEQYGIHPTDPITPISTYPIWCKADASGRSYWGVSNFCGMDAQPISIDQDLSQLE